MLYGTLGGRSRNGWGSLGLTPTQTTSALPDALDPAVTLPWRRALNSDWAQAIGTDERGPLIWQTAVFDDWKSVMVQLAKTKIGVRAQFVFPNERPDGRVHDRHWLSYPITNHSVREWGNNARLPNSLRFKVRRTADNRLRGVVFHMPCMPPPSFQPDRRAVERVWQQVHGHLDQQPALWRAAA